MSEHNFSYTHNAGPEDGTSNHITISVGYDDKKSGAIEDLINAFVHYLSALTYSPVSIAKYIKTDLTQ
jgi:hypothetical protein